MLEYRLCWICTKVKKLEERIDALGDNKIEEQTKLVELYESFVGLKEKNCQCIKNIINKNNKTLWSGGDETAEGRKQ